ncbi:hypothetical protein ACXC9Q_38620 (plasmid) [Kribbella sp. CWNU-51]
MFDGDLETLTTADLLASAAEHDAEARRVDARRLLHAQIYADRYHPSAHPGRPGRRACDGRERAVVLGGDGCPEILEFAIAEFAVMLGISPRVAANYIGQALALRHRFPFTWARVQAGEATPWKACRIVTDCAKLTQDAAAYVDQRIARLIDSITPYRLNKIVQAAKMHADADLARAEADEQARERGVFVARSNEHGTKTMYIKAAAGAVIRNKATLDAIAEALKTFGDTRPVQHRRADAVGIIADPRYTQELLTQARTHRLSTTTPDTTSAAPATTAQDNTAPDATGASDTTAPGSTVPSTAPGTNASRATAPGTTAPGTTASRTTAPGTTASPTTAPYATNHSAAPAHTRSDHPDHPGRRIDPAAPAAARRDGADPGVGSSAGWHDEDLLDHPANDWGEPGAEDEADRDAPHPSVSDLPDPLDAPPQRVVEPFDPSDPGLHLDPDDGEPLNAAAQRALHARLAKIKHAAYTNPTSGRVRPGQTQIYVHLTDHTLATGTGVLRAEAIGPLLADQLADLIGYGPYAVKPVIDLNDAVSVDAYEIPDRIRERVKLTLPVELFPFGTQETHRGMDLDHIQPYDPLGPPGQTSTTNLAPLGRFGHRVKTHAHGWTVHRIDPKTLEWTTPHGFSFRVDPTGTHRVQVTEDG